MALRTSLVAQPHLYMGDTQGRPLDAGKVYFGEPNKDPELYPINVYYDEALTIAAPQPIRTMGGFMNASGQMVEIYAAEIEYSVKVLDAYGRQVFYQERMINDRTGASLSTKLPYPDAIERTVQDKASDSISAFDFGAAGDGTTDDTSAFELLESNVTGRVIDLQGKTYSVNHAPNANSYKNGYFSIAGIIHPSELKPLILQFKKYCANLVTGNRWDNSNLPIFAGADNTFQAFCIVPSATGNPKIYMTQRADRADGLQQGNWLKYETYRIVEYDFKEDGSNLIATAYSQPLSIGHGAGLSYTVDDVGQLWLYSGYPSDSETDTSRSDKGFSRIKWLGATTSNNNVTYYQMFDYVGTTNAINSHYNRGHVSVSCDGKTLAIKADNTLTGALDVLLYDLAEVLAAVNPKTVQPLSVFSTAETLYGVSQGIAVTNNYIVLYYDTSDGGSAIKITDYLGSAVTKFTFDTYRGKYTAGQLLGANGVLEIAEGEGVFVYANDIYIGYRECWNSLTTVVSYNGKFYAPRATVTGVLPTDSTKWQEVSSTYGSSASAWSASTTYSTPFESRIAVNKYIYKLSSLIEDTSKAIGVVSIAKTSNTSKYGVTGGGTVSYTNGTTAIVETNGYLTNRTVTASGKTTLNSYDDTALVLNTDRSQDVLLMQRAGINYSSIYNSNGNTIIAARNGNNLYLNTFVDDSGSGSGFHGGILLSGGRLAPKKFLAPSNNNDTDLGEPTKVFKNTYLQTAPVITSDERLKQDFRKLKAAEKKAAIEIKESICLYKMKDSAAEKGNGARWHVGVKAQQIVSIMESHKLKPFDYGFICHDTWLAQDAVLDEEGNEVQAAREAGDKYAVRYDELAMFIIAAV